MEAVEQRFLALRKELKGVGQLWMRSIEQCRGVPVAVTALFQAFEHGKCMIGLEEKPIEMASLSLPSHVTQGTSGLGERLVADQPASSERLSIQRHVQLIRAGQVCRCCPTRRH